MAGNGWALIARVALDALLPPRCLSCGAVVPDQGTLCLPCWERIDFLAPPLCAACGLPFELDPGADALCGGCAARQPPFRRARAVFRYDDFGKGLILRFKHADRTEMAPALARWMARAGAELLDEADLIVPVPLHWTRLFGRRYNQAALLALALGRLTGLPVVPDLLLRRRRTPSQGGLGREARRRNIRGAFATAPHRGNALAGARVVLIDDVLTTGATTGACARALLAGGAEAVDVLTVARVV